jgi:hypothetical protein
MCETNACVSCRALDDSTAGLNQALLFRMFDDEESCAILDRSSRVLEFGFS